jgi:hypothetical protein
MTATCGIKSLLEWSGPTFALVAAFLWVWSAWPGFWSTLAKPINVVDTDIRKKANLNASAAACAIVSAVCQIVTLLFPICRDFG